VIRGTLGVVEGRRLQPLPELVPVESSSIDRVGYDAEARELVVRFHSGRTYVYRGVPEHKHAGLLAAMSKGAYVNREIKPHYDCRVL
jgi:hypothetical protein